MRLERIKILKVLKASIYGKCIVADYNSVYKDKCAKEFMLLKDSYLVSEPSRTHILFLTTELQKAAGKR